MSKSKKKSKKKKHNKKVQQKKSSIQSKNIKNNKYVQNKKAKVNASKSSNFSKKTSVSTSSEKKSSLSKYERFFNIFLILILTLAALFVVIELHNINILPIQFMILIIIALLSAITAVSMMLFSKKLKIVARIVSVVLCIILIMFMAMLRSTQRMLNEITNVPLPAQYIGVYVCSDSDVNDIEDISECRFGALKSQDREHTDMCINELESKFTSNILLTDYDTLVELAIALREKEIDAIITNVAYLDILDEDEELSNYRNEIKLLWYFELPDSEVILSYSDVEDEDYVEPFIVYVCGNDSWGKLRSTGRSDVNILLGIDQNKHEILLVNTPRDYFVELSVSKGQRDKLTHAGIYGVDVSIDALSKLYNVPIKHYVRLNFAGFMNIIDALGGVTVNSTVDFKVAEWHYHVGENNLSGIEALAFARERYSFTDGDRQRGKNQAAVISAVVDKVTSPSILWNYQDVMKAASGTLETSMTQEQIVDMIQRQIAYGGKWEITTIYVDGYDGNGPTYSSPKHNRYIMLPNEELVSNASKELHDFLCDNE